MGHASIAALGRRHWKRSGHIRRPRPRRLILEPLESRILLSSWSGVLDEDATWCGTEELTGDVTIQPGVTLTIQPGTVVKAHAGAAIIADGVVDAQGTDAEPIIFTSLSDDAVGDDLSGPGTGTPAAGDWEGPRFNAGSVVVTGNSTLLMQAKNRSAQVGGE